ncbi:hypothetical protein acsn021_21900 [Anaerocolumna cellulosilytica]|uniref:Uncharacterized protein n=1 Tax=Anaerocolumna cellulosilytica TaxID=433286 RepID=A0A6S6R6H0_9FIRM|nr:hypothetical protein [Anaerocolumna cellulosilytica]MBB5194167.1 hypothetical protein [Anaerocolumna cellulosilytica]BCJ94621.1 hypothetical protein acsn021_21900 [Anaerocolumna cellulosilytica]
MKPFGIKNNHINKAQDNNSKNNKSYTTKNIGTKKPAAIKQTQAEQSDWFYMSTTDVKISDIAACLEEAGYTELDLWEDMGVLQVELAGKFSIDFEHFTTPFKDPLDKAFIESRKIQTIYTITLQKGNFYNLRMVMSKILDKWEGIVCADTADFEPVYDKNRLKADS